MELSVHLHLWETLQDNILGCVSSALSTKEQSQLAKYTSLLKCCEQIYFFSGA